MCCHNCNDNSNSLNQAFCTEIAALTPSGHWRQRHCLEIKRDFDHVWHGIGRDEAAGESDGVVGEDAVLIGWQVPPKNYNNWGIGCTWQLRGKYLIRSVLFVSLCRMHFSLNGLFVRWASYNTLNCIISTFCVIACRLHMHIRTVFYSCDSLTSFCIVSLL